MTDLTDRINEISLSYPRQTSHDALIETVRWLFMVMMERVPAAPEWTTIINSTSSPQDFDAPDSREVSKTYTDVSPNQTVQFRYQYTYSGGNKTGIVFQYYDAASSPQWQTVTGGTATLTYDGSGNFTGATTA